MSASFPCIGGIIAPPRIIITKNAEPWEVNLPSPLILNAKIEGHIIEQNKPPLKKAKIAIVPLVNKPTNIAITPNKPKVFNVRAGLSFPIKNPAICIATQIAKAKRCFTSNPEIAFTESTTAKAK